MSATSEARKLRLGLVAAQHHRKSWRRQLLCGSFQLSCCQICPVTTRGFHKLSTDRFDPRNWPNKISKLQQKFELDNWWFWAAKKNDGLDLKNCYKLFLLLWCMNHVISTCWNCWQVSNYFCFCYGYFQLQLNFVFWVTLKL